MNKFSKSIKVNIAYLHFEFEDINEAIKFADSAAKNIRADKEISVEIEYELEDDEDEV